MSVLHATSAGLFTKFDDNTVKKILEQGSRLNIGYFNMFALTKFSTYLNINEAVATVLVHDEIEANQIGFAYDNAGFSLSFISNHETLVISIWPFLNEYVDSFINNGYAIDSF